MPATLANSEDILNALVQLSESPDKLTIGEVVIEKGGAHAGGTFATVFRVSYNGRLVAIKALRRIESWDLELEKREYERESRTWWLLKHENILPLLGCVDIPYLSRHRIPVAPWCEHGSLASFMEKNPNMAMRLRTALLCGIVTGIQYLHNLPVTVVHGDVKPANIVIDETYTPMLCDFGLCRVIHDGPPSLYEKTGNHLGTTRYLSPELVEDSRPSALRQSLGLNEWTIIRPTTQSDIWALGCVAVELLTGVTPYGYITGDGYASQRNLLNEIKSGHPPANRPVGIEGVIKDLWKEILEPCWRVKPKGRPTIQQINSFLSRRRMELELLDYSPVNELFFRPRTLPPPLQPGSIVTDTSSIISQTTSTAQSVET